MPDKTLPSRPNLEQYKKQAKDLARDWRNGLADSRDRARKHHPRFFRSESESGANAQLSLTDAQLVIAREHGFESWPKFAAHITTLNLRRSVEAIDEPVAAFLRAACCPREASHNSGTLEEAELILQRFPQVAQANIHTAAVLADDACVREWLARDAASASTPGGPYGWDALTYLCFSRYLRIDRARSDAFVRAARALLDAGANANTGWYETIDHPNPRQILESAIYGAAGVAQHAGLTRLLLEYGADPNDEETPYHVAEGYDLEVLNVLLKSGRLSPESLTTLLVRKADWHDTGGIQLLLEHGADPNAMTRWGFTGMLQALRRDNRLANIVLLLDYGGDPTLKNNSDGRSGIAMAAHHGRGDVLLLLHERGVEMHLDGIDRFVAACALGNLAEARAIAASEPAFLTRLLMHGGTLLGHFAGNGNTAGVQCLLDLGVSPDAISREGDPYFEIARDSTALHAAAWRGRPETVRLLIERGTPLNAVDGRGRTALMLAVRACVDSYWKDGRSPEWVEPLLNAGASLEGIEIPCGYDAVDKLLMHRAKELNRH